MAHKECEVLSRLFGYDTPENEQNKTNYKLKPSDLLLEDPLVTKFAHDVDVRTAHE